MFGVAIVKSAILSRWIGGLGLVAGVITLAAGVVFTYVGFSSARETATDRYLDI